MNTNQIKKFACEARNILKKGIRAKIQTLGYNDKGQVPEHLMPQLLQGGTIWNGNQYTEGFYHQWMAIYREVSQKGIQAVYEEAAYTWFNRLMAIRILQKNGFCEPVLVYTDEARTPRIVDEARMGRIPQMKDDARRNLMELLEDDTKVTEQFAVLITAWCHNNPIIQACFGAMEDFTELLLPINILAEGGFVDMINHTDFISDDDFHSPELIGWLYQFYISERKDEVFAKKGKFEADEIPAATQIFTPNWIVKYMVQNTVGRIYLDNHPGTTAFKDKWKYLVDQEPTPDEAIYQYDELTDLKVADLASGSGHILNECFDLLYDLYIYEGYSRSEAVENIFKKNLTGIDIDNRAKQLSMFALMVKACQKDDSFTDAHCLPKILDMPKPYAETIDYNFSSEQIRIILNSILANYIQGNIPEVLNELTDAILLMNEAQTLGSIMKFDISEYTRNLIQMRTEEYESKEDLIGPIKVMIPYMKVILALTDKYSALAMNPPYMGNGNMNEVLSKYVKENYEDSKADLFAVFMDLAIGSLQTNGKYGMINMQSWMFLSSFEKLRKKVLDNQHIDSMLHLGPRTFDELSGEVVQNTAFVISNNHKDDAKGTYYRLIDGKSCSSKEHMFINYNDNGAKIYYPSIAQSNFEKIPGCPIGYWVSDFVLNAYTNSRLSNHAHFKRGIGTGSNSRFLRLWFEVNYNCTSIYSSHPKWFKYNKGGTFRKWYGNRDYIINWENDGYAIKNNYSPEGKQLSRPQNLQYNFQKNISYSSLTSVSLSFRCYDDFINDQAGNFFIVNDDNEYKLLIALLNSNIAGYFKSIKNNTFNITADDLLSIPILKPSKSVVDKLVDKNMLISSFDWDAHETSWDFQTNEIVAINSDEKYIATIQDIYDGKGMMPDLAAPQLQSLEWRTNIYKQKWEDKFFRLHANEEELNRQFIDIYGLQDELTPDVPLSEITILQQGEISIENDEIKWHDDVLMKQLISYAVGCMMGRFSIDKPGLILANQGDGKAEYDALVPNSRFEIDDDCIIPLMTNDCGFGDNASQRFSEFTRQAFGDDMHVVNLNYVEKCLGKTIEQYFVKDFWKDHKKMYQNRPIYWLFSSKKGAFQCLVYMHRMNPYTVERVRSKYLLPYIEHLWAKVSDFASRLSSLTTAENKQFVAIANQLEECSEYQERLQVVAEQQISFDLDDGVLVNYSKFGDVLAKIK